MSTLPLSGVNSRFLAPSRFPAFHLKSPAFLAYFELEKMHSVQLVKANSLCKMVKLCVFCLFDKLRLSRRAPG